MRIENTSRIPTKDIKPVLVKILHSAPLGKARSWLQGKDGLYVTIQNASRSRVAGRIYPDACSISRKGKRIKVRGYIKLYVFSYKTLDDIAKTFAHELSHFKDWYDYDFLSGKGKAPYGKEKRARAFASRTMAYGSLKEVKMRPIGTTEDGRIVKTCRICEGTGRVTYQTPKGYTKTVKHPRCNGTGIILKIA